MTNKRRSEVGLSGGKSENDKFKKREKKTPAGWGVVRGKSV